MCVDLHCGILNLWPGIFRLKVKVSRPRLGVLSRSMLADIDIQLETPSFLFMAAGICVLAFHIRKGR